MPDRNKAQEYQFVRSFDVFDETGDTPLIGQQLIGLGRGRVETFRSLLLRALALDGWKSFQTVLSIVGRRHRPSDQIRGIARKTALTRSRFRVDEGRDLLPGLTGAVRIRERSVHTPFDLFESHRGRMQRARDMTIENT